MRPLENWRDGRLGLGKLTSCLRSWNLTTQHFHRHIVDPLQDEVVHGHVSNWQTIIDCAAVGQCLHHQVSCVSWHLQPTRQQRWHQG